jgi:RNase P subunit RPR2
MTCYVCNIPLIWGGDSDIDEDIQEDFGNHTVVTNLSCQQCGSFVYVYHGKK